jgi:hypothetical protein
MHSIGKDPAMSMYGYPRRGLSKYRSRKNNSMNQPAQSLFDPGLSQFHPSLKPVDTPSPQDLYLTNPPQQYRPNLNAPAVDWSEYDPPSMASRFPPIRSSHHDPRLDFTTADRSGRGVELDGLISDERIRELSPLQSQRDLYERSLHDQTIQYNPQPVPGATEPLFSEPTISSTDLESPNETDVPEGMPSLMDNPVSPSTGLATPDRENFSLEQIVQQEFDNLSMPMTAQSPGMDLAFQPDPATPMQNSLNQINQAMDQMMQMPQPEQEDPFLLMQKAYDQQMQFMANSFMMPMMGPM